MNKAILFPSNLIRLGIPLAIFGMLVLAMQSSLLASHENLSLAITADLLLTVPLIYFLLIRKSDIPQTTVVPVLLLGLLLGKYFLPEENQFYLTLFQTWALPVIELSVLTFVILKVRQTLKAYRAIKHVSPDFYDTLRSACAEILPKQLVSVVATEIAVFYYGFICWKKQGIRQNEFTYHKKGGASSLFGAFVMILVIETIALHFLLAIWNPTVAWILTGLSLYTMVQVFACIKAFAQRPIVINDQELILRYGIMNETHIPLADIESVTLSRKSLKKDRLTRTLSPLGEFESHNVILHLKQAHKLTGLYGVKKKYNVIGFHIDAPQAFNEKLIEAIGETTSS
ncbi:MAG: hypothetical protein AAFR59_08985 [Bacteroidota bacterium]